MAAKKLAPLPLVIARFAAVGLTGRGISRCMGYSESWLSRTAMRGDSIPSGNGNVNYVKFLALAKEHKVPLTEAELVHGGVL